MRSVLLQLHIGSPQKCEAWSNISASNGVQITVYSNPGLRSAELAARICFSAIQKAFSALGGGKDIPPCGRFTHPPAAYNCQGAAVGMHKRVLVYIADGSGTIDSRIEHYFSVAGSIVICLVDVSLGNNFNRILPATFKTKIVQSIQNFDPTYEVSRILIASGISNDGFRLFISYKHDDAATIAGQLFHRLSERMFDVFLDRFSSRTGDDFVSLVQEELFDKACVLVLETDRIGQSVYCRQEVGTALSYDLGLLAVDLPSSRTTFPSIYRRHNLLSASHNDGQLSPSDLDGLVDFIERSYTHEVARRTRAQDANLVTSIVAAGLYPQPVGIGQYRVNNGNEYLLSMCSRPPGITEFIDTENLTNINPPAKGVIFGPISVVRTLRANQISWLGQKSTIAAIDEGHVMRTLNSISLSQPI